jgi:hypothetical protein
MAKVQYLDALKRIKMNFSVVGVRTPLKDYELAYWMNVLYKMQLVCRKEAVDEWSDNVVWEYNVFDGKDPNGEPLCMITNQSIGNQENSSSALTLFDSAPEKHLLPTVKHWDYILIIENSEFAFDLEGILKGNDKITTAQYFEAHTQLTQRETHLLYEIRNA